MGSGQSTQPEVSTEQVVDVTSTENEITFSDLKTPVQGYSGRVNLWHGKRTFQNLGKLDKEESKEIAKNTGFTNSQVNNLYKRFNELDKQDKGYLSQGSKDYKLLPPIL